MSPEIRPKSFGTFEKQAPGQDSNPDTAMPVGKHNHEKINSDEIVSIRNSNEISLIKTQKM